MTSVRVLAFKIGLVAEGFCIVMNASFSSQRAVGLAIKKNKPVKSSGSLLKPMKELIIARGEIKQVETRKLL